MKYIIFSVCWTNCCYNSKYNRCSTPLRPDQEINNCWFKGALNGVKIAIIDNVRATNVKNKEIAKAGIKIYCNWEGKDNNPNKKNISICIRPVIPSKKFTRDFLLGIALFPKIIPVIYVAK